MIKKLLHLIPISLLILFGFLPLLRIQGAESQFTIGLVVTDGGADVTAPTTPTGLSATASGTSQINLSWTASTDAVGVTGYKIYRAGVQIATSATNSYSNTGLSSGTSYSYTVSAYDAASNESSQSSSASATTDSGGSGVGVIGTGVTGGDETDTTTTSTATTGEVVTTDTTSGTDGTGTDTSTTGIDDTTGDTTDTGGVIDGTTSGTTDTTGGTTDGGVTDGSATTGGGSGGGSSFLESIFSAIPSVVTETVGDFQESYKSTKQEVAVIAEETKKVIETPVGSVVTKTVTTVGAVGGGLSTLSALFLNPISFSELFLIPFRIWSLLLTVFGLKKRYRPWGTVYDSVTKQPLDPAFVTLIDEKGNTINSLITDLDGRYGFLLTPGATYKVMAAKTNYIFPSKKLAGRESDELYNNLYFGGDVRANELGEVVIRNIPMDPTTFDWNEFAKKNQNITHFYSKHDVLMRKISNVSFVIGFAVALVSIFLVPAPYNYVLFGLYVLISVLRIVGVKPKTSGVVKDKITGEPLSFAIVRIISKDLGMEIMQKVTDQWGKYYALVGNGVYTLKIEKKNLDESYTLVFESPEIEVKNGVLNQNFEL